MDFLDAMSTTGTSTGRTTKKLTLSTNYCLRL